MANFLFPPIIQNTMEAMALEENSIIKIIYSDPSVNIDYDCIRVKITRQSNNTSLVDSNIWLDQYIYIKPENNIVNIERKDFYPEDWLKEGINKLDGEIIKIQLSYVSNLTEGQIPEGENYYNAIRNAIYSEWSTVLAIKFIRLNEGGIQLQGDELSTTPLFQASYSFTSLSKENKDKYKFDLYLNSTLLESSGWQQSNIAQQSIDEYRFKTALQDYTAYLIKYSAYSQNGYYLEGSLNYLAFENSYGALENIELPLEINYEESCIDVYLNVTDFTLETGYYILSRSSEKDNFQKWEDMYIIHLVNYKGKNLIYTDYTIESGIEYKYGIQKKYANSNYRSNRFESADNPVYIYFPYSYLYANGVQLKLKYNNKVSSYKNTVLANKQDTLGSKYPTIFRNGSVYYAEFPVTGLISLHLDDGQKFFKQKLDGYYYQDKLVIPATKYINDPYDVNLTGSNFYIERIFREKVEEFLNDGGYKLYRSPTEGNHIVTLMNISETPNQQLGRMISEFTSTAYEVMDYDLEQMFKFGIIDQNQMQKSNNSTITVRGQIELFTSENSKTKISDYLKTIYTFDNMQVTKIDIDMGNNQVGNITINEKDYLIDHYYSVEKDDLNISHSLDYPVYINYIAELQNVDSLNTLSNINKIENKIFTGQIAYFETDNTLEDIKMQISRSAESGTTRTYLRLLSLKFEGDGTININGKSHIIPSSGLNIQPANNINSLTDITSGVICNYTALIQEVKENE